MKRILIFSTAYLPMQGGAELAVKEITDRIIDFEFDLICARLQSNLPKTEKIGIVNVHRIGFGNRFDKILLPFFGFLKARKICRLSLSANHSSLMLWGIMASWGSLAAFIFKIFNLQVPFLLTLQEGDAEKHIKHGRWGLVNLSWKWILKKADFVQVISRYLADMARQFGYKKQIEIVPNGVDLHKFSIFAVSQSETPQRVDFQFSINAKRKLNIQENDKIIITVSRLAEKNGIEDLVNGFKLLIINYQSPVKLLILGSGPLENNLKSQVKKLGLEGSVILLGDVPNNEMPKYLAIADVFVRPSLSEGLGTAFLEAMAAGVPVIGTRVGGIPDFLIDPSAGSGQTATGLFCEVKNPESIAEKIKLLLENNELRNNIILNARKIVGEKYDWDKIAKKMDDIFSKFQIQS